MIKTLIKYLLLLAIVFLLMYNSDIRAKKHVPDYDTPDLKYEKAKELVEDEFLLTGKDGLLFDKEGWAYPSVLKQSPLIDEKDILLEGWATPRDAR